MRAGFRITAVAPSVEMQMLAAGFSNGDVAIWNLLGGDVLVSRKLAKRRVTYRLLPGFYVVNLGSKMHCAPTKVSADF